MDIRNFFGGNKVVEKKRVFSNTTTDVNEDIPIKVKSKRNVIASDDDEEEFMPGGKVDKLIDEGTKNLNTGTCVKTHEFVENQIVETRSKPIESTEKVDVADSTVIQPVNNFFKPKKATEKTVAKSSPSLEKENVVSIAKPESKSTESITSSTVTYIPKSSTSSQATTAPDASWKAGESVPYSALVSTFEDISKVSGRIEKENLFAKLFKQVIQNSPSDLESIVYLASNNVFPPYEGTELGW